MRIYTSRRQDRRWVTVLASCLGTYLVLAVGFHWFLQPTVVKNSEAAASKLPPATFVVPDRRLREPTTSGQPLRGVAQRSAKQLPAPTGEPPTAETAEQVSVAAPKKEPKKKVVRRAPGDFAATYPMYSGSRPF